MLKRFHAQPFWDASLTYSDPPEGCEDLISHFGEVILLERGGCPFIDKVLNAQKAGAKIAIITDSSAGSDDFIDMVSDETNRKANISCAWLPGNSGRRIRQYLMYTNPSISIDIPLNYTNKPLRDTYSMKPHWYNFLRGQPPVSKPYVSNRKFY
uniref:PA domain-containing protein n=1 Tax=Meloidogyne hapla TaxID=6305 RepID=A0A1I8BET5_MELHA